MRNAVTCCYTQYAIENCFIVSSVTYQHNILKRLCESVQVQTPQRRVEIKHFLCLWKINQINIPASHCAFKRRQIAVLNTAQTSRLQGNTCAVSENLIDV